MSTIKKVAELEAHRLAIQEGARNPEQNANAAGGQLSARQRIDTLLDSNSFVEIGAFMKSRETAFCKTSDATPADGVICGYGTVNGKRLYVYSQDATVLGGSMGEVHAEKIIRTYDDALKVGAPVVAFIDTVGLRLQEGMDALTQYGRIFAKMTACSGHIPLISVVCGDCAGGVSFIAGLSDFTLMATQTGKMFLNSPHTLQDKTATYDTIAAPEVHLAESGLAVAGCEDEVALIQELIQLISYLPAHCHEEVPCYTCTDDLNRMDEALNAFDFEQRAVQEVMASIVDNQQYLELYKAYGTSACVALARMDGGTVGIVANQAEGLDYAGVDKITRFVNFCDRFNIPLVTLVDVKYFESTVTSEKQGMIRQVSQMIQAFVTASVPKVSVLLKNALGTSHVVMNSKMLGCDYVYAWPTAEVAPMNSESAVKIMCMDNIQEADNKQEAFAAQKQKYEAMHDVYAAAARGYIDDIIEPAATRKRVIAALEMLLTKNNAVGAKK